MNSHRKRVGRPQSCHWIHLDPDITYFKPAGVTIGALEQVELTLDELEAIRLADLEELYHLDASEKMNISRQTFGRIIASANKNIAEALVTGEAIKISEGVENNRKEFKNARI